MAEPRTRESSRRLCGRSLPRSSRNLPHHCQTDTRENLQSCAVFFEFAHLCSQKQTLGSISYPDGQAPLACWLQGCLSFLPWKRGWWGCEGGKQLGEHTYLHSLSHTHTHSCAPFCFSGFAHPQVSDSLCKAWGSLYLPKFRGGKTQYLCGERDPSLLDSCPLVS